MAAKLSKRGETFMSVNPRPWSLGRIDCEIGRRRSLAVCRGTSLFRILGTYSALRSGGGDGSKVQLRDDVAGGRLAAATAEVAASACCGHGRREVRAPEAN